jgi:polyhydroxyalkanoate synthesis regulator phasin
MTSNVKMILDEVNARIKLAEAKTAEDPSNFDSFPGAENDKPVADEKKKPDPEVKEEGPASRTETTGAEPGSDVPLQQDHLYEADEPVLTPEKKPAESDDANAKEAADKEVTKVASDILNIIKGAMAKKAEAPKAEATKKASAEPKTPANKPEKKAENMNNNKISLENRILDKIASVRMAKQAGANDASALIKAAADYNRGAADAAALIQKVAQAMAAAEDPAAQAAAMGADAGAGAEPTPEEAGAADAEAAIADAAAADEGAGAEEGAEGAAEDPVTPEEVVEAVNELVEEGQISEEDAAEVIGQLGADTSGESEGDLSEDQLAEGIAQAIDSGEITEDEAQQLVQELVDAGADESIEGQVAEGDEGGDDQAAAEEAGAADAAEAAGAADAEAALADAAQKEAEAHNEDQIARYQRGFIQKCAEYGCDPQRVAQYMQARLQGAH